MAKVDLFSTPLHTFDLKLDTNRLLNAVEEFRASNPPLDSNKDGSSNVGGQQIESTSSDGFNDPELFQEIANILPSLGFVYTQETGVSFWSWININSKGSYNKRHTHINTNFVVCGVYYVQCPENSGPIRFWDPRGRLPSEMRYEPWATRPFVDYTPKTNELLLFPSWLEHEVLPSSCDGERISIAFNVLKRSVPK